jgi:predicted membrane protein
MKLLVVLGSVIGGVVCATWFYEHRRSVVALMADAGRVLASALVGAMCAVPVIAVMVGR